MDENGNGFGALKEGKPGVLSSVSSRMLRLTRSLPKPWPGKVCSRYCSEVLADPARRFVAEKFLQSVNSMQFPFLRSNSDAVETNVEDLLMSESLAR